MKRAAKLLILIGAGFMARPTFTVSADGSGCLYQCEGSMCADFGNTTSLCVQTRARCLTRCSQPGAGGPSWGAIAYSVKDKQFGFSYGWQDLEKAKKSAVDNCVRTGKACKPFIWFNHQCGALAADGEKTGWGVADAKQAANQRALLECANGGGRKCVVRVSQCSR